VEFRIWTSESWIVSQNPSEAAAAAVVTALQESASASPRLAISGGSALVTLGLVRQQLSHAAWRKVRLTWVDERCVPFDDPQSNRGQAYRNGHLNVDKPPALELGLYLDGESQAAACERVTRALAVEFDGALDVLLLGMGEDGHIASLFPGFPQLHATEAVVAVSNSPKPPPNRITLTLPMLRSVPAILIAQGTGKRDALAQLKRREQTLPAAQLERVTVVTDQRLEIEGEP